VRVFVTGGGRGFIGGHVVRALVRAGYDVRRDWVDVRDRPALEQAMQGCEAVLHVAALYSFTASPTEIEAVNVGGTRNVIAACRAAGVRRLVHTSSAGTCGPVPGRAATEKDSPPDWELRVPYKRTKLEAEKLVFEAEAEGLDALCVNPTTPIGEGDDAPTPTGQMVRGVASGRYRATLHSGGLNLVDVRDVADGHVLALERGRAGERYILGGADLTLAEVFAMIARTDPPALRGGKGAGAGRTRQQTRGHARPVAGLVLVREGSTRVGLRTRADRARGRARNPIDGDNPLGPRTGAMRPATVVGAVAGGA
jgi:dihydroflavonol-4-reductase